MFPVVCRHQRQSFAIQGAIASTYVDRVSGTMAHGMSTLCQIIGNNNIGEYDRV